MGIWYNTVTYPVSYDDPKAVLFKKYTLSDSVDTLAGLDGGNTYYFSLVLRDSAGNWSDTAASASALAATNGSDFSSWTYSRKLYFNTTTEGINVSGNVTNFPILIRLNESNFDFNQADAAGSDIRFTKSDNTIELSFEIERWEYSSQQAWIWVQIDTVYGNDSTQYINMHWGKTGETSVSSPSKVFRTSNYFQGVWHLNEDGNTIADGYKDATANADHGTGYNFLSGSHEQSIAGHCAIFDGINRYIDLGTPPTSLGWEDKLTVSMWVRTYQLNGFSGIFAKGNDNSNQIPWIYNYDANNKIYFDLDSYNVLGDGSAVTDSIPLAWHLISFTWDGNTAKAYVDGVLKYTDSPEGGNEAFWWEKPGYIGYAPGLNKFNGKLDEVRISNIDRSADWHKLCYWNQMFFNPLVDFREDMSDWTYSTNITLNTTSTGANVPNNVLNFPVLVRLNAINFNFGQTRSDGGDIRFTKSDGTQLDYEIERWDNSGNFAEIWVKIDTVFGDNNSQYITMHWGNEMAVSQSNGAAVFDTSNGFAGVWHLDEETSGTGTVDIYQDATNNNYDLDDYISNTDRTGVIGNGKFFDGDDFLTGGNILNIERTDNSTMSAWINQSSLVPYPAIMSKTVGISEYTGYIFGFGNRSGINTPQFAIINSWPDNAVMKEYISGVNLNEWIYLTVTYNGSSDVSGVTIYINGTAVSDTIYHNSLTASILNSVDFKIGARQNDAAGIFHGYIDEPVVSTSARSANWIKLSYENQRSKNTLLSGFSASGTLSLDSGSNNSNLANQIPDCSDSVAVIHFALTAGSQENMQFDYVRPKIVLGDASKIEALLLVKDEDANGIFGASDVILASESVLNPDFSITLGTSSLDTITAGSTSSYLILLNLKTVIFSSSDSLIINLDPADISLRGLTSTLYLTAENSTVYSDTIIGFATPPDNNMTLNAAAISPTKISVSWNPSAIDSSDAHSVGV
ncbi:MAG: DUF2341 domain-containing protein, partial [Fibrobacteria bacterium]|nr:DUF2341 domain-containing protein [Fibrobacteria bacterium]